MDNPSVPASSPVKPAMKASGTDRFRGVMPIAVMAFALVALLLLIFFSIRS